MFPLTGLMTGVALLLVGSGLLGTLLTVRGGLEGFSDQTLGLVMSGYFAGFFAGTYAAPPLISRIGHIRAFAFYTGVCAIAALLHPIWVDPFGWFFLRVLSGVALVGLYTVIESWLGAEPEPAQRSRVFTLYMAVNLGALAAGQLLLGLGVDRGFALFSLVAILSSAAALPVTLTRLTQPSVPARPRLGLRKLYRISPGAAAAAFASGLAMGAFWGLGPVYARQVGFEREGVGHFMVATILGGALLQWPVGRLSDRADRRVSIAVACCLAAMIALAAIPVAETSQLAICGLFFVYGGLTFSIYPMSVAHMLDTLPADELLPGCSSLLLVFGLGAAVGPSIAGACMSAYGPAALPLYFSVVLIALAGFLGGRLMVNRHVLRHPVPFQAMLRTTPGALELVSGPPPAESLIGDDPS